MFSFSSKSANPLEDSSHGSKPKSSSCDSRDFEVKPKAACQSVQLDTCNDSDISVVGISGTSVCVGIGIF